MLLRKRRVDIHSHVIVWQIACTGDFGFSFKGYDCRYLPRLMDYLLQWYPKDHEVIIYEASQFPVCESVMERIPLSSLTSHKVTGISTLYIPPVESGPVHLSAMEELGLNYLLDDLKLVPDEERNTTAVH